MSEFYDQMDSLYHLIFPNWEASIERQATQLSSIIGQVSVKRGHLCVSQRESL